MWLSVAVLFAAPHPRSKSEAFISCSWRAPKPWHSISTWRLRALEADGILLPRYADRTDGWYVRHYKVCRVMDHLDRFKCIPAYTAFAGFEIFSCDMSHAKYNFNASLNFIDIFLIFFHLPIDIVQHYTTIRRRYFHRKKFFLFPRHSNSYFKFSLRWLFDR